MSAMGNARAAVYWEAALPPEFRRPPENDMAALRTFITDKYVSRRYASRQYPEPPTIENYMSHPVRSAGGRGSVRRLGPRWWPGVPGTWKVGAGCGVLATVISK